MTESAPPPPVLSLRGHLHEAASVARLVAALLVTAVSVRFSVVAGTHALVVSGGDFGHAPLAHSSKDQGSRSNGAVLAERSARSAGLTPSPSASSSAHPMRVTLGVNYGEPRSEVYVNGSLVGQTPFVGDTSCKFGQPIRIEVVPTAGLPLTYLRRCYGGSLELNGPPP